MDSCSMLFGILFLSAVVKLIIVMVTAMAKSSAQQRERERQSAAAAAEGKSRRLELLELEARLRLALQAQQPQKAPPQIIVIKADGAPLPRLGDGNVIDAEFKRIEWRKETE